MPERMRLVVVFGGRSAEHDVSCVSGRHVITAADPERYEVVPVGITREGQWVHAEDVATALASGADPLPDRLVAAGPSFDPMRELSTAGADSVVFPVLHGPYGEDGTIQGLFDLLDVAYVGSGVLGSALSMDKVMAKHVARRHGVAQARWRPVDADDPDPPTGAELAEDLGLPLFVKPANLGSSVGISRVSTVDDIDAALKLAFSYDNRAVLEEAINGREIEVAVLGNTRPIASVPGEIVPADEFYSYEDKYVDGAAELRIPAPLPDEVAEDIRGRATAVFGMLRCAGLARIDFFYEPEGRGILFNEANTMPGFTPISMYPRLWAATGIPSTKLIDELVALARERHDRRRRHRRVAR